MSEPIENLAELGQHIRTRRHQLNLTLDQLAHLTAISKPYLSNIETARAPGPPSPEKLARLELALHFPPGHLAALADYLRTPTSIRRLLAAPHVSAAPPAPLALRHIPLINRVAAGHAAEYTDLDYPADIADRYVPVPDPAGHLDADRPAFALRVRGDSMAPAYRDGDLIILGTTEPRDGDDCLVRLGPADNFATTFKQVFFLTTHPPSNPAPDAPAPDTGHQTPDTPDDGVRLAPRNPAYNPRTVSRHDITGIFPVLWKLTPMRSQR